MPHYAHCIWIIYKKVTTILHIRTDVLILIPSRVLKEILSHAELYELHMCTIDCVQVLIYAGEWTEIRLSD